MITIFERDHARATHAQHQVEGGLLLDVVLRERAPILQLFTGEDETLYVGPVALSLLNILLYTSDGITRIDINWNDYASQRFDKDLHGLQAKHQLEKGPALDIIV